MFDRYVDKELRGVQPRDVIRLISRTNCERRCLEEKRFVCRSANYYRFNQECRLFSEEQSFPHTQLAYAGGVDYLENQCNVGEFLNYRYKYYYKLDFLRLSHIYIPSFCIALFFLSILLFSMSQRSSPELV
ncbi:UNVERIFIED_CONTAM: hypothetical protein NCL1_12278 [Trichonephila clavipes]